MWCFCSFVCYHIWLFRKHHIFVTLVQIVAPVLIIILLTLNSNNLHRKTSVVQASQQISEQSLYDSVVNPQCKSKSTQIITYCALNPTYEPLAQTLIKSLQTNYFSTHPNLKFVQVENEMEMIKVAVIHHALLQQECYIGAIVFEQLPALLRPRNLQASVSNGNGNGSGHGGNDGLENRSNSDPNTTSFNDAATTATEPGNSTVTEKGARKSLRMVSTDDFRVKIRMVGYMPSQVQSPMTDTLYYDLKHPRDYKPFLGIQMALSRVFMETLDDFYNPTQRPLEKTEFSVQPFPFPNIHIYSPKSEDVEPLYSVVTIALVLGQTFMVASIIKGPAFDKETGFRTYLNLMGLPRIVYWLSWYLNELLIRMIVGTLQIALLFTNLSAYRISLIQRGDYVVWGAFLLLYNMASISFLIFIASFCKRGIVGIYVSATVWLLTYYFGDVFLSTSYFYLRHRIGKYFMCLNPNSALILATVDLTAQSGGVQWETVVLRPEESNLTLLEVMAILGIDIFLYFILTLYSDVLRPGSYSVKFWHHCGLSMKVRCRNFWNRRKICCKRLFEWEDSTSEIVPPINSKDILFSNVTVHYGNKANVLNDCNLQIAEKTSTAIIAPNGAGKSTIVKLICGAFPPNSGQVTVAGYDTTTDRTTSCAMLSLCPEENLLCSYITLLEHLKLIGKLKGQRMARIRRKAKEILAGLELNDCANRFPNDLVSIQKRKLCIAMSLIGKSDIILLDCPMRGLDAHQTIPITKFLKEYCDLKTLIHFTPNLFAGYNHANRIAILANGKILGSGSKEQLEACLKIGYHLHLQLMPGSNIPAVVSSLRSFLSTIEVLDKESFRIQNTLEMAEYEFYENPRVRITSGVAMLEVTSAKEMNKSSKILSTTNTTVVLDSKNPESGLLTHSAHSSAKSAFGSGSGLGSGSNDDDQYFDARSKITSFMGGDNADYSNFDELFRDPLKSTANSITLYLPTTALPKFPSFFQKLEKETQSSKLEANESRSILSFTLVPYTIQLAYDEVESYMKLNEAKVCFGINSAVEITAVNSEMLDLHMGKRLKCMGSQRFKAQIYKELAITWSEWQKVVFQFIVPFLLVGLISGATQHSFLTKLEEPQQSDSLGHYLHPVAMIKYSGTPVPPLVAQYKVEVSPHQNLVLRRGDTFENVINSFGKTKAEKLAAKYVVGADITPNSATAAFSPTAFHAAPISLSLLTNAFIKGEYPGFSIKVTSHPIQPVRKEILNFYLADSFKIFDMDPAQSLAIVLSFGLFTFTSCFIVQPVMENVLMFKKLQLNTGMSVRSYWFCYFLEAILFTSILAGGILTILVWLPTHVLFKNYLFICYCLLYLVIAGLSCIAQSFLFTFILTQPKTSYFAMMSYNQVAGLFLYIVTTFFDGNDGVGVIIKLLCRLFQPFNVPSGFFNLFSIAIQKGRCQLMDETVREAICRKSWNPAYDLGNKIGSKLDRTCCKNFGAWDSIKDGVFDYLKLNQNQNPVNGIFDDLYVDFIFLVLHFFLGLLYIGCMEKGLNRKRFIHHSDLSVMGDEEDELEDDDGCESGLASKNEPEAGRQFRTLSVSTAQSRDQMKKSRLIVEGITRKYFVKSHKILNDVSFVVLPGELIAIVGPSKSGKTVLLEILARFRKPSSGKVFFDFGSGKKIKYFDYLDCVGYRPGSVSILQEYPNVKGITFLRLFARLRGIPEASVAKHVNKWSKLLGLEKQNHMRCAYYTDAMRSRFALALTFIGDPPILILDEPLEHLDPFTKRQFWTITEYLRTNFARMIIMATSCIEDIEPHCSKMGILVNGELECLMRPSLIKSKFGGGFILHINFIDGATFLDWATIKARVSIDFPSSNIHQEEASFLEYRIEVSPPGSMQWSTLFSLAQAIAVEHPAIILDYHLSEETLRHIYENVARKQRPYSKPKQTREEFCTRYC